MKQFVPDSYQHSNRRISLSLRHSQKHKHPEYRCLILERMKCELLDVLPSFLEQCRAAHQPKSIQEIALGPVCTQLIRMVEAVHQSKNILLDVKPDNLMICNNFTPPAIDKSKTTISTEDLAASIRLVDLGLLKSITGTTGSHTENIPASEVQGTPMYSSLNVHKLQTPSRRDDVYAMLYVVGEVILRVNSILHDTSAPYGAGTKSASYFPWSQERNDAAIGKVKEKQMKSVDSSYFSSMPNKSIAGILFSAHQQAHDTKFSQKPNYDTICTLLSNITITIPTSFTSSAAAGTAVASTKRSGKNRSTFPLAVEPPTTLRRSTRRSSQENVTEIDNTSRPSKMMKKTDLIEDISSYSDDATMYDAEQSYQNDDSDVEMIDITEDRNEDCKPAASSINKIVGLQFTIEGGLNNVTNNTIVLTDKNRTMVITGRATDAENTLVLPDWNGTLRLTLSSNIANALQVQPKNKQAEVKLNNIVVPPSGTVAFIGQKITFGHYSVGKMKPFHQTTTTCNIPKENIPLINKAVGATARRSAKLTGEVAKTAQLPYPKPSHPFLVLKVTSPESMKGTAYVLEQNVSNTRTIGSGEPSNQKDKAGWIYFDPVDHQIEPKHASVSLVVLKGGTTAIEVHDLKSNTGTYIGNERIPTGEKRMLFCNHSIRMGNVTFVVTNSA